MAAVAIGSLVVAVAGVAGHRSSNFGGPRGEALYCALGVGRG